MTLTASRHVHFLLREVPASRVMDYKAFVHAVQNDEAQDFTLERDTADDHASRRAKNFRADDSELPASSTKMDLQPSRAKRYYFTCKISLSFVADKSSIFLVSA